MEEESTLNSEDNVVAVFFVTTELLSMLRWTEWINQSEAAALMKQLKKEQI